MSEPPDNERLLAEVMADESGFRDAMLGKSLRLARRRRHVRQARRVVAAIAIFASVAVLLWKKPTTHSLTPSPETIACDIIHTQPLAAEYLVTTQPLATQQIIASLAFNDVIATTTNRGEFQEINDAQLLALVTPHPAVLVRLNAHTATLVFANPEDQKGFPMN